MVLVAGDHIGHGSLVVFQQLGGGFLFKVAHLFAVALVGSQEIHRALHKADGRHFVNDQKALFVCHLVQFFGIGVVAGAEAVCADPLHQLVIALDGSQVQAAAADVGIFVLAKTAQIHRFAVEQEVAIFNFKGTDADLVKIFIDHGVAIGNADDEVVQVSGMHIPQLSVGDFQSAGFAAGFGHLGGAVQHFHRHIMAAIRGYGIVYLGTAVHQAVGHLKIQNTLFGQGQQLDRAVDTRVIVEIKVRCRNLFSVRKDVGLACGQHVLVQFVVGQHSQLVVLVVPHNLGHVGIKG